MSEKKNRRRVSRDEVLNAGGTAVSFDRLASTIAELHDSLRHAAAGTVNRLLTCRNWLIGMYIVEYEQKGADRAEYGARLLRVLADRLSAKGIRGLSFTNLNLYRQFYSLYPQIVRHAAELLSSMVEFPEGSGITRIIQEAAEQLDYTGSAGNDGRVSAMQAVEKEGDGSIDLSPAPEKLLRYFSFTHFVELLKIKDPVKRAFYEVEGMLGNWSVPQLKRQIESLLYERTGLSKKKKAVVDAAHTQNMPATVDDMIRDPYVLEFTGLPESPGYSENELETALLDHIQSFLLELGNGFCFEARQKRITLDNEHDRIDLVFYHRLLRCHVLIDLKVRKFQHGDAGQMNFYLNYYRENMMAEGDNPPVGLILCTDRDETRVKYATSGMDNRLFVSQYQTALPSEETIRRFLENDRDRTELVLRERGTEYRP